jgi:hypothetical protein
MSTQATRTVTVFATKGKRKAKIETNATKWSELRDLISNEGYDVKKLHATENVRRSDLTHEDAALPEGDFTVFLRPKKTKSGGKDYSSMGFKALRAELNDEDKDALTKSTGKNWTRCSTDDLRNYLSSKDNSDNVEETTEVEESNAIEAGDNNTSRLEAIKVILAEIRSNTESDEVIERLDLVEDELAGLSDAVEVEDSPEAVAEKQEAARKAEEQKKAEEEAARKDKEETDKLDEEASSMMEGF